LLQEYVLISTQAMLDIPYTMLKGCEQVSSREKGAIKAQVLKRLV
jgi:hypothetical protein